VRQFDGDDPTGLTGFETRRVTPRPANSFVVVAHADHDRLVTQDVHVATFNGGVVVDDLFVEEEVDFSSLETGGSVDRRVCSDRAGAPVRHGVDSGPP